MQEKHDLAAQAAKGVPAVLGTVISAMTLNEWVMVATLVYIGIQAAYLVRKWIREETEWGRKIKRRG